MATKTDREIVIMAMKKIAVIAPDETPDANDYDDALAEYVGFHAALKRKYIRSMSWQSNSVPEEVAGPLSSMLAEELTSLFPVDQETAARVSAAAARGERQFREYQTRGPRKTVEVQSV